MVRLQFKSVRIDDDNMSAPKAVFGFVKS